MLTPSYLAPVLLYQSAGCSISIIFCPTWHTFLFATFHLGKGRAPNVVRFSLCFLFYFDKSEARRSIGSTSLESTFSTSQGDLIRAIYRQCMNGNSCKDFRFACHRRIMCRLLGRDINGYIRQFYPSALHNDTFCSGSIHYLYGTIILDQPYGHSFAFCNLCHNVWSGEWVFNMASVGFLLSKCPVSCNCLTVELGVPFGFPDFLLY